LNLEHDKRWLECKGSYTYACTVCYFQAQVWKVEFGNYIWEFRRRSPGGEDAFRHLLLLVPSICKEIGAAIEFANNLPIYHTPLPGSPMDGLNCWGVYTLDDLRNMDIESDTDEETARIITRNRDEIENEKDKVDKVRHLKSVGFLSDETSEEPALMLSDHLEPQPELTLSPHQNLPQQGRGPLNPSPLIGDSEQKMNCMITLGKNLLKRWTDQILKRQYPCACEAIRILRMCCYEAESNKNVENIRENGDLLAALCKELSISTNPEVCLNSLEIFTEIVSQSSYTDDLLVKNKILEIAANSAYYHSGCLSLEKPVIRSTSIVVAALRLLQVLTSRQDLHLPTGLCSQSLKILDKIRINKQSDKDKSSQLLKTIKDKLSILGGEQLVVEE